MKFFLSLTALFFSIQVTNAQLYFLSTPNRPPLLWQKCLGGSAEDIARDFVFTNDGIVVAGDSKSNDGDITGHHGSTSFTDGWVVKLHNDTSIEWQVSLGGSAADNINRLIATNDGGFICAGTTRSVDGDITNNHGGADVWIVKLNSRGEIVWSKAFGGSNNDEGVSVLASQDGSCIFTASVTSVDGDVQTSLTGTDENLWIVKLDSSGNITWQNTIDQGGAYAHSDNTAIGIVETAGNTIIAGCAGYDVQDTAFTYEDYTYTENDSVIYFYDTIKIHTNIVVALLYKVDPATGAVNFFTKTRGAAYYNDFSLASDAGNVYVSHKVSNLFFIVCDGGTIDHPAPNYIGYNTRMISKIDAITGAFNNTPLFVDGPVQCPEWEPAGYNESFYPGNNSIHIMPGGSWVVAGQYAESTRGGTFVNDARIYAPSFSGNYGGLSNEQFNAIKAYPDGNEFVCAGYADPGGEYVAEQYDVVPQSNRGYDFWVTKMSFNPSRITGTVRLDTNNNNLPDVQEPVFKKGMIKIKKYGSERMYGVDDNGHYEAVADTGTYTIEFVPYHPAYFAASPAVQTVAVTSRGQTYTTNFAVHQTGTYRDYSISLSTPVFFRPGFPVMYDLTCINNGTDTFENRHLVFVKDSRLLADQPIAGATVSGDTITWYNLTILPFSQQTIHVPLHVAAPPIVNAGDTLFSFAMADTAGDQLTADNYASVKNIVRGSYDPNDKQESHAGAITQMEVKRGHYLEYTIRFQNTGNDTAFNIVIRDSLDPRLQSYTFEMTGSSHPYNFRIEKGKYITWNFTNANLADSIHNEPASHGYITYRIQPKADLLVGDNIKNNAAIYFDYNLPVSTNTENTLVKRTIAVWTGIENNAWENPANWDIKEVPDAETLAIIPAGAPNYPTVNINAVCFGLQVATNAAIRINEGYNLDIRGK